MTVKQLADGSWEVSLYLPGSTRGQNRRFRRRYQTQEEAGQTEAKLKHGIANETVRDVLDELDGRPAATAGWVKDLADRYYDEHVLVNNADAVTKKSRLTLLKEKLGKILVVELRPSDVSAYVGWRKKRCARCHQVKCAEKCKGRRTVANATINRDLDVLHHMLVWARRMELIRKNPLENMLTLQESRLPFAVPRLELEAAVAKTFQKLDPVYQPIFSFILETGCRRGEALSLKHDQVFFEERVCLLKKTKGKRPRYLPLTRIAIEAVGAYPKACEWVFYNPQTLKRRHDCRGPWERAREEAGVPWLTIHHLRKAFSMRLSDMPGIEKHVIQTLLGHESIRTTEEFYALHDQKLAVQRFLTLLEGGKERKEDNGTEDGKATDNRS